MAAQKGTRGEGPHLFSEIPRSCAIPVLEVEYRRLGHIDAIGQQGYQEADDSAQYPALGAIEQHNEPAPPIFAASQLFHAVCVGNAVVDPVGASELVVPSTFVRGGGEFGLGHRLLALCESLY